MLFDNLFRFFPDIAVACVTHGGMVGNGCVRSAIFF